MTTPTKKPKPAAPFRIDGPGLYLTRDGRTVEVCRSPWPDNPGCAWCDEFNQLYGPTGAQYRTRHPHPKDIIARAPVVNRDKPAPASKVRRYVVEAGTRCGIYLVIDRGSRQHVATCTTRADARAFAAMKNATARTTTSKRKGSK